MRTETIMTRQTLMLVVLVLAADVCSAAAPSQADINKKVLQCKAQFAILDVNIKNLHEKGKLMDENDSNARCFVQCTMSKIGQLVDSSGKFNASAAKQNLKDLPVYYGAPGSPAPNQTSIAAAVDSCAATDGTGNCGKNYKIWTCLYTALHSKRG